jgi:uncharacterized protein YjiS (DUF1127 family)
MSRQTLFGALPSTAATDGFPSSEQENSSTPWPALSRVIRLWAARHHQRSGLRELAEQDDPLLRDMGICKSALTVDPSRGSATPWFSDTKWKFGGVTIGADDDPADAMNSPANSCT